jgi:hypothetical protein
MDRPAGNKAFGNRPLRIFVTLLANDIQVFGAAHAAQAKTQVAAALYDVEGGINLRGKNPEKFQMESLDGQIGAFLIVHIIAL